MKEAQVGESRFRQAVAPYLKNKPKKENKQGLEHGSSGRGPA
jgi:hypothetical protein